MVEPAWELIAWAASAEPTRVGSRPLFSLAKATVPRMIWRRLLAQEALLAASRTLPTTGMRMLARMPMMAMTVRSSIRVNAARFRNHRDEKTSNSEGWPGSGRYRCRQHRYRCRPAPRQFGNRGP